MSAPVSRRFALFRIGNAVAASAAVATVPSGASAKAATPLARYLTPDQYIDDMQAIGARAVAAFHYKLDGSIHRMGCFERTPEEGWHGSIVEDYWRKVDAFTMIRRRSNWQDRAWADEVWERSWALGHREDMTPQKLRDQIAARAAAV